MPEGHAENTYKSFSQLLDKLIADDRRKTNLVSVVADASGQEQKPPKKVAPGLRQEGGGGGGGGKGGRQGTDPNLGSHATGGGKDPKGKGKGKGGKHGKGNGDRSGNTDSESEAPTKPKKPLKDYDGIELDAVPEAERCCLHYLWVTQNGGSRCYSHNKGKECKLGKHTTQPSKAMLRTKLYASMKDRFGPHNVPKKGPNPPKQAAKADGE